MTLSGRGAWFQRTPVGELEAAAEVGVEPAKGIGDHDELGAPLRGYMDK